MSIKSLTYSEFRDDPKFWELNQCDFVSVNLIVGRNATGKTRLIHVISNLCKLLSGKRSLPFKSGRYQTEIIISETTYKLILEFNDGQVINEFLEVNGERRIERHANGEGEIFYAQENKFIKFKVPPNSLILQRSSDELQHPFVNELSKWAQGCQTYFFGTSLGKDQVIGLTKFQELITKPGDEENIGDVVSVYSKAFQQYGADFDKAIIQDMEELGYKLSDVGSDDMRQYTPDISVPEPLIGMFVTEIEREAKLPQMFMSQGMFRTLALVIYFNIASFAKQSTLILVDDIGEGLDYERSVALIDVLMKHAKESNTQLIMTTNDRFVMNRVPLEYWSILRRKGQIVRAYTERNSLKEYEDFKFIGLSNFDFFTSAEFD